MFVKIGMLLMDFLKNYFKVGQARSQNRLTPKFTAHNDQLFSLTE